MPHFNFLPSIEEVKFIQSQSGYENIDNIYDFDEVFELGMEFTIGGLKYLKNPLYENEYASFYLNTITYVQRGMKDIVVNGLISEHFDERFSETNNQKRYVMLTKFRNSIEEDGNMYDFINNIYFVEIFVTKEEIKTKESLEEFLQLPHYENILFKTKIPYINNINKKTTSENDGRLANE